MHVFSPLSSFNLSELVVSQVVRSSASPLCSYCFFLQIKMVRKCPALTNNNSSLIWSVVKKTNCFRRQYKDPKLNISTHPASQKCVNKRSQVGFVDKKQLTVLCKKNKIVLVRQAETKTGKITRKGESMTGPRRANRKAYEAGINFLKDMNLAKAARIKACTMFCATNTVKTRKSKTTSA